MHASLSMLLALGPLKSFDIVKSAARLTRRTFSPILLQEHGYMVSSCYQLLSHSPDCTDDREARSHHHIRPGGACSLKE
ncbi:hypothetical protein BDR06DRAFT_957227 [Suillus hirtellus]|nr:hypothetical protein BDR06DRAFT_957227 [Suillus hirtellus]